MQWSNALCALVTIAGCWSMAMEGKWACAQPANFVAPTVSRVSTTMAPELSQLVAGLPSHRSAVLSNSSWAFPSLSLSTLAVCLSGKHRGLKRTLSRPRPVVACCAEDEAKEETEVKEPEEKEPEAEEAKDDEADDEEEEEEEEAEEDEVEEAYDPMAELEQAKDEAGIQYTKAMDDLIRLQADLQNYRREHDEAMSRAKGNGKIDALKKLLPISEDIKAAIVEPEGLAEKDKAIFDSYSLLFRKVDDVWSKVGAEMIAAEVGDKLDPAMHVAVKERPAQEGQKPGTVIEVLKAGWKCDGRTVAPAKVIAAKEKQEQEEEADEAEDDVESSVDNEDELVDA